MNVDSFGMFCGGAVMAMGIGLYITEYVIDYVKAVIGGI
jgi:hypothetical protein